MIVRYVMTISNPGYLPEPDPIVVECAQGGYNMRRSWVQLLDVVTLRLDEIADDEFETLDSPGDGTAHPHALEWNALFDEIATERRVCRKAPIRDTGCWYTPNGLVIEVGKYSVSQLIGMGYEPDFGETDVDPTDTLEGYVSPAEPDFTLGQAETAEALTALAFREAYGLDSHNQLPWPFAKRNR